VSELSLETRRTLTLAATILGSSLAFIDATVVFVALPTLERDLNLGLTGQQWVVLSYSLALASLYLAGGAVGDRYGRLTAFTAGVVGFAAASAIAGAAPNGGALIAARTLQGIAGAFLTTNSLALLRSVYGDQAGRAIGLWTAFTSVATIGGPPAGGALVEWVSWRWIFFLNLPLAVATVVLARLGRCDERTQVRVGRLDIPGAALAALGFGTLTYGLVEGTSKGFGNVWWSFVVAALALAGFVWVERHVEEPMLPLEVFRERNFAFANLETFLVYGAIYAQLIYFQLYLQFIGFSPFEASLVTIPSGALMILLAARFGALADRSGPRLFLATGPAMLAVSILLILLVRSRGDFWIAGTLSVLLAGLSLALFVAPITATALKSAPAEYAGIASGVNSTVSRLGNLLAVALVGLVVSLVFHGRVDAPKADPLATTQKAPALRDASIEGFRAGMLLAAGLALAGATVGALGITNLRRPEPAATEVSAPAAAPVES